MGHSAAGRIMSMKNSNDTNGKRTRDLPACSAGPQAAAPPCAPLYNAYTMHDTCNSSGLGLIALGFKLLCTHSSHFMSLKMATWLAEICSEVTGYIDTMSIYLCASFWYCYSIYCLCVENIAHWSTESCFHFTYYRVKQHYVN